MESSKLDFVTTCGGRSTTERREVDNIEPPKVPRWSGVGEQDLEVVVAYMR